MERYSHVMVIGGTGMLVGASRALAGRCDVLTSVARTERSLRALDEAITESGCTHHTLALDWSSPDSYLAALTAHIEEVGAPFLIVAWLHHNHLGPESQGASEPRVPPARSSRYEAARRRTQRLTTRASPRMTAFRRT